MREILFRGKRIDNGKWVKGYLYRLSEKLNPFILLKSEKGASYEVDQKTVGQYTGMLDKNGTKIFEGDICNFCNSDGELTNYEVLWFGRKWVVREANSNAVDDLDLFFCERSVVIGNIYDNPELLGDESNDKD